MDRGVISTILGVNGRVTFIASNVELSTSVEACKLLFALYSRREVCVSTETSLLSSDLVSMLNIIEIKGSKGG